MSWRQTRRAFLASTVALTTLPYFGRAVRAADGPNRLLGEALALAMSSIAARLDPELGYQPYFHLDIVSDPPEGLHSSWDYVDTAGRFVAAFVRSRQLGMSPNPAAEAGLRQFFLANQKADGLFYDGEAAWSEEAAESFAQSRAMFGLVDLFLATGDRAIQNRIEAQIIGIERIVEPAAAGAAFPGRRFRSGWLDRTLTAAGADDGIAKPGYGGLIVEPLLRYHQAAGSPTALALASKLIDGFVGLGAVRGDGHYLGHTHSWGILPVAIALVDYAALTGRAELLDLATGIYDFTVAQGTPWGWIPDGIGFAAGYPGGLFCETCGLSDLIVLGLKLARLGQDRAWGDVDRFVRNQLVANQFRETDPVFAPEAAARSRTNAAAILRGSFDAWARPNSLLGGLALLEHGGLEACCTGSAVVALQQVHEAVVSRRDGALWVDLPLTVTTADAVVESYEPAEGRLAVVPRTAGPVRVRRLGREIAQATIDGALAPFVIDGDVLAVDHVLAGARLDLRFPLPERTETRRVADLLVTATWRGSTVVGMTPAGERYPIYRG